MCLYGPNVTLVLLKSASNTTPIISRGVLGNLIFVTTLPQYALDSTPRAHSLTLPFRACGTHPRRVMMLDSRVVQACLQSFSVGEMVSQR